MSETNLVHDEVMDLEGSTCFGHKRSLCVGFYIKGDLYKFMVLTNKWVKF